MSVYKYLLDENLTPRLKKALLKQEPEMVVLRIGDICAPPLQTSDPDILVWCEAKGFFLVTNNRASMPVHLRDHLAAGRHVPGIFVLKPDATTPQIIDELILIWQAAKPDEYKDQLQYIPLT
jgi:hypothetical protein